MTNDVEVLNEMFSSGIVMVFSDVFTIIGILYFMFSMNWQLALISLSVLPLLFYGTFLFRRKAREAYREVRLQIARINTFMQEHITGMMVDQVFNRERESYRAVQRDQRGAPRREHQVDLLLRAVLSRASTSSARSPSGSSSGTRAWSALERRRSRSGR